MSVAAKELGTVLVAWRAAAGRPCLLATVVETVGSAYRHAGARMLVTRDGWVAGSVSGGCLESDLVRAAWERTEIGPALLTYDTTSDADAIWGFGLGCRGVLTVLAERLPACNPAFDLVQGCLTSGELCTLATIVAEGPLLGARAAWSEAETAGDPRVRRLIDPPFPRAGHEVRTVEGLAVLVEAVRAPVRLVIVGAGHDGVPLVRLGRSLGWRVIAADTRQDRPDPGLFAEADERVTAEPLDLPAALRLDDTSYVVLMSHSYLQDLALLDILLRSPAPYIGVLASRSRVERLAKDLSVSSVPQPRRAGTPALARAETPALPEGGASTGGGGLPPVVHAPVGLDLGAEGPDQIALAITAEILAISRGRCGGSLSRSAGT